MTEVKEVEKVAKKPAAKKTELLLALKHLLLIPPHRR